MTEPIRVPDTAAPRIVVWGAGTPRTLRVHWALREIGLAYECRRIAPRSEEARSPEYRRLNPKEKIPTLQDGDLTLTESAAIVTHLCEAYGESLGLMPPARTAARAAYYEWSFFAMTELDALSLYVIRRHAGLPQLFGEAPAAVRAAREGFDKLSQAAELRLGEHGPYILGAAFTGVDILLASCLLWARRCDLALTERLHAYVESATARPAYRAAVDANGWP